jgi:serine-type D-Ala-D-Ala carboxypeptidase/endopeptidase (penicillin-binding protein 4)
MTRALVLALAVAFVVAPASAAPRKRASKPLQATSVGVKESEPRKAPAKPAARSGAPPTTTTKVTTVVTSSAKPTTKPPARSAARVAFSMAGELRPTSEVIGRREESLTVEENVAKQIEKLLRGPLRRGITGLYVADARTGEPLFAVNAEDSLNPASNVKMISTAAALELLGPSFRYSTRVFGREPDRSGTIGGDLFLLGTWDPTLSVKDMADLAKQLAARGLKQLDGDVLVGGDPTRDGIYRAMVPIDIQAGEPGQPPTAALPTGWDFVDIAITAKTDKQPRKRHKLTFKAEPTKSADGKPRIKLAIGGTIGKGRSTIYPLYSKDRTAFAAHALRAALRAQQITVNGDVRVMELGDFIGDAVGAAGLPIELARHDSDSLQDIVRRINKWSVNWLADRVIMTAAALARRTTPSMDVAVEAMYEWMQRHSQIRRDSVVLDTGSGLSYRTRITPQEIVKIVRAAAGYTPGTDPSLSKAWQESLAVGGTDGTLRSRFRVHDLRGQIRGKTGSLSTVIALSGLLELDPARPLAFSIVTNTDRPLSKPLIRKAHEQLVRLLAQYVTATAKPSSPTHSTQPRIGAPAPAPLPELDDSIPSIPDEIAEPQFDPDLDDEAASSK